MTIHTLPHLICIRLVPVRSSHLPLKISGRSSLPCINMGVRIERTKINSFFISQYGLCLRRIYMDLKYRQSTEWRNTNFRSIFVGAWERKRLSLQTRFVVFAQADRTAVAVSSVLARRGLPPAIREEVPENLSKPCSYKLYFLYPY